jgi:hypothetical protein
MKASLVVSPRELKHQNLGFYLENEPMKKGKTPRKCMTLVMMIFSLLIFKEKSDKAILVEN